MLDLDDWLEHATSRLLRFAYLQCGSREMAEDVVHDVVVELLRRRRRIEKEIVSVDAYSRRAVINRLRTVRRRANPGAASPEPVVGAHDNAVIRDVDLHRALAQLSPRQRAVVVLRFYEDRSHREIALLLGCTESSARSLLSRAMEALRVLNPDSQGVEP